MSLTNYNEFKGWVRWHDYVNISINEFPIVVVRNYEFLDVDQETFIVQILGLTVIKSIKEY